MPGANPSDRSDPGHRDRKALEAARRYYLDEVSTPDLAEEFGVSRSTVSRWITLARRRGWVRISILDPLEHVGSGARSLMARFGLQRAVGVSVASDSEALDAVAQRAAAELAQLVSAEMTVGIAWGTTMSVVASHVLPLGADRSVVVQLNGAGTVNDLGIVYAEDILGHFARAWNATGVVFPVPAFFDHASTRDALWRERSVNRVREIQRSCDLAIFSIGSARADVPSRVYQLGYLDDGAMDDLCKDGAVGDIATNFFRLDGSHDGIALNTRASGIPLNDLLGIPTRLCVVSGVGKAEALAAALRGGFITHLVADDRLMARVVEITATDGDSQSEPSGDEAQD